MAHISGDNGCLNLAFTHELGQRLPVFTPRWQRIGSGDFDRQFHAEVNFTSEGVPVHVRSLEAVFVQKKTARPNHRSSAVMLASDRSVLEIGRIVDHVLANEDIPLPRASLEKNRQRRKPETLL